MLGGVTLVLSHVCLSLSCYVGVTTLGLFVEVVPVRQAQRLMRREVLAAMQWFV